MVALGQTNIDESRIKIKTAGAGAITRTQQDKNRDTISVKDYGAKGDGITDDTVAIQAAITAVSVAGGGVVNFPKGTYKVTNAITIPASTYAAKNRIRLKGDGAYVSVIYVPNTFNLSALGVFVTTASEPGPVFDSLEINFQQNTAATNISQIVNYPPAIYVNVTPRVEILDCAITLAWKGIAFIGNSGGPVIRNLQGSGFNDFISFNGGQDIATIEGLRFWPYKLASTAAEALMYANAVMIRTGRQDGLTLTGGMCFGLASGCLVMSDMGSGITFASVSAFAFDTAKAIDISAGQVVISSSSFTSVAYPLVEQTGGHVVIGNSWLYGTIGTSAHAIRLNPNGAYAYFGLTNSWWAINGMLATTAVLLDSTSGVIHANVDQNKFEGDQNTNYTLPIIQTIGANVRGTIRGNTIKDKGTGTGTFIAVQDDTLLAVKDNVFAGWVFSKPAAPHNLRISDETVDYLKRVTASELGAQTSSAVVFCTDCKETVSSTVQGICAAGGSGTMAVKTGADWKCFSGDIKPVTMTLAQIQAYGGTTTILTCSDCKVTSGVDNTCTGSGSGAMALKIGAVWKCIQ